MGGGHENKSRGGGGESNGPAEGVPSTFTVPPNPLDEYLTQHNTRTSLSSSSNTQRDFVFLDKKLSDDFNTVPCKTKIMYDLFS